MGYSTFPQPAGSNCLIASTAACPRPSSAVSLSGSSGHIPSFGTPLEPVNFSVADLSATSTQFLQPSLGVAANTLNMMNAADVPLDDSSFNGGAYSSFASPCVPCDVNYTPASLSIASPNELTVSPNDLMLQGLGSAPNSTALTDLTSPNINESPEDLEAAYCFSGNVESVGIDSPNPWYTLFPDAQPPAPRSTSESSSPQQLNDSGSRSRGKSDSRSPKIASARQSDNSGVGARKRNRVQAPIIVDENDPVAMKRARNTLAARKSRERKLEKLQELEDEISRIKKERDYWKSLAIAHGAKESACN
ncbi:hypothetical protein CDD81_1802 [Ophiocordyceps australis]|uniref:Cross-pathway control protein 1 n=1 Tax=Ophiocordyceps australis TaxID=1399860 RepID=A0A2C5Y067_9HYPO|nr:hypothetical protein CDD81_1802 [Ophiocordyceps australis]